MLLYIIYIAVLVWCMVRSGSYTYIAEQKFGRSPRNKRFITRQREKVSAHSNRCGITHTRMLSYEILGAIQILTFRFKDEMDEGK